MWILKLHYFLWFGGLSGVIPIVQIFAREHAHATATQVGVLYLVLPFVALVVKPLICYLADKYQAHKLILTLSLIFTFIGYGLLVVLVLLNSIVSWIMLCLLVLIANTSLGVVTSLTDSIVMKEITETKSTYGSHRLWGTLGWGLFGILAGFINKNIKDLPYLVPGLLMFDILILMDILLIAFVFKSHKSDKETLSSIQFRNKEALEMLDVEINQSRIQRQNIGHTESHQVWRSVIRLYAENPSLTQYSLIVIIIGMLTAFHWSYFFWFVETVQGKDTQLMGLAAGVQCFLGELPFFIVSHLIVGKVGPSISLSISTTAFAIRYIVYGYFIQKNQGYYLLLTELTQGPTFGLFYCVMTSLAQDYGSRTLRSTNEKLEIQATMQGIMSALFEGAGLGIGSLVGGFIIDGFGISLMWRAAGFIALTVTIINVIIEAIKLKSN